MASDDAKPGILRNLKIKRVSLVDSGANLDAFTGDGAHIMLFKRDTGKSGPSLGSVHVDSPAWDVDDQDEYEKADLSGEARRRLPDSAFAAVWTDAEGKKHRKLPIHDAGHLAAARGRVDGANIPTDVKAKAKAKIEAATARARSETKKENSVKNTIVKQILGLFSESDEGKRKEAVAQLSKAIEKDDMAMASHDPDNADCKCAECMAKLDKEKLDKEGLEMKAEVGKKLVAIEKANADLVKSNADLVTSNATLAASIEVEKNLRLDRDMVDILKSFKATPFKLEGADSDVAKFRKMKADSPDTFARVMEVLKAAAAQAAAGLLFARDLGSGRTGTGSAWDQLEAKADALIEKDTKGITREQALEKIMLQNPKLVQQYREEQQQQ